MFAKARSQKKYCIGVKNWGEASIKCFSTEDAADAFWKTQGTKCSAKGECINGKCTITKIYISDPCSITKSILSNIPFVGGAASTILRCEEDTLFAQNLVISEGPSKKVEA